MFRWLRVVLPSLGWLILFAGVYGGYLGLLFFLEWRVGQRAPEEVRKMTLGALGLGAFAYASWRVHAFHPLSRPGYRSWLAATPWTSRQRLPLGPVHLVLQDVVLVGLVMLTGWYCQDRFVVYLPQLFLTFYLVFLGGTMFLTGAGAWGYAVYFGLGLILWFWHGPLVSVSVALAVYLLAYRGLRRSLAQFPWERELNREWGSRLPSMETSSERANPDFLGWPFGLLAPRQPGWQLQVPLHHALLISMLVGWLTFTAAPLLPQPQMVLFLWLWIVGCGPAIRLAVYCTNYRPPISFWGRLVTGRWIIPGYDQVLVGPLLALVWGFALGPICAALGLDLILSLSLSIALGLFLCLGLGPSLRVWRLTGKHRIVEGGQRPGTVRVG